MPAIIPTLIFIMRIFPSPLLHPSSRSLSFSLFLCHLFLPSTLSFTLALLFFFRSKANLGHKSRTATNWIACVCFPHRTSRIWRLKVKCTLKPLLQGRGGVFFIFFSRLEKVVFFYFSISCLFLKCSPQNVYMFKSIDLRCCITSICPPWGGRFSSLWNCFCHGISLSLFLALI